MKKKILLFITIIVCSIFSLQAQINKGDWLLGGSLAFNSGNSSSTNANISPNIGIGIGKNAVIGLGFGVSYLSNSGAESDLSFSSHVFYKKYFVLKNKLGYYLLMQGGIGLTTSKYDVIDSSGNTSKITSKSYFYNVGITPGIYYEIVPRILFTADVGGLSYHYSDSGSDNWSSNFILSFLNSFTFGVDFILGKRQSN